MQTIEDEVKDEIDEAFTYAKESPLPGVEEAFEDAYADMHESMPVKGWS